MMELMVSCANEHGIPEETVRNMEPIPDDKKCFFKCLAQKTNLMDDDGNVTSEKFIEFIKTKNVPQEKLDIANKCVQLRNGDACDTAKAICMCMKQHSN